MLSENLIIINNEKVYEEEGNFFCENLDLKVLPEELNNYHKVKYIVRSSKKKNHKFIGKMVGVIRSELMTSTMST